jgi:FixJ family two-component response regulator
LCTKDEVRSAMQAGASDFILKPFDIDQVLGAVEELIAA